MKRRGFMGAVGGLFAAGSFRPLRAATGGALLGGPHHIFADGFDGMPGTEPADDGIELGQGVVYHIAKTGSDSNPGTAAQPFLTINKFMSVCAPGDTGVVRAGVYIESTVNNPHVPPQVWMGGVMAAVAMRVDGGPGNRCTLMAHPDDVGGVVIDGGGARVGIHTGQRDYWNLWGLRIDNCLMKGIASWGQAPDHLPNFANLSRWWKISNCSISLVTGPAQDNVAGIGAWGTQGWHIINTRVHDIYSIGQVGGVSGLLTYGAIGLLVEHCQFSAVDHGIFLKDHFLQSLDPRLPAAGAEIRYCVLDTREFVLFKSFRGDGACEAGTTRFHHNICYGQNSGETIARAVMGGTLGQSEGLRFEHNLFDVVASSAVVLECQALADVRIRGNILVNGGGMYRFMDTHLISRLTQADYNLFTPHVITAVMDEYGPTPRPYWSLESWQAALASESDALAFDRPDIHSRIAQLSTLFVDRAARDYRHRLGSPALGLMPDGTHCGPYQTGQERIGLLSNFSAV